MVAAILLVLTGCKEGDTGNKRVPQAADTLYTAAYAMTFVDTEPERALLLIDSARLAGNLSLTCEFSFSPASECERGHITGKKLSYVKYSSKRSDFLRFYLYLRHVIDDFACLELQH